jgi:SAM-dependent methyltransferase
LNATPHADERSADTARFFSTAIRNFGRGQERLVLDFGCGAGSLVRGLESLGYDSYGCDMKGVASGSAAGRIREIDTSSGYSLPFPDASFDVVVSTSVLEHAQNKRDCFDEIHRVLKPGGFALHLFPARRFLLAEPHINVPLANWFWPRCPNWWFAFWALVGVRNSSQRDMDWRSAAASNRAYFATGLSYWSTANMSRLARAVFGNCEWPTRFYLDHSPGGFAALSRKMPLRSLWDYISREFRYSFMLTRKPG